MTPSISFLVPVYNVEPYLAECLDSILTVTREDDEVILVDDGSTDGSGALCDAWQQQFPGLIQIERQRNQGLSAARNRALSLSSKPYVYFLDSDDVICPASFMKARERLAACQSDILTCDALLWPNGQAADDASLVRISHSLTVGISPSRQSAMLATFRDDFMSSSSRIFKRELLTRAGPAIFPPGRSYEDNSTVPRLIAAAQQVDYLPEPIFRYRIRSGSITQSHSLPRCVHQATSFAPVLLELARSNQDQVVIRAAHMLAFRHIVRAVQNASHIRPVKASHFKDIITQGLGTLTLAPADILNAIRQDKDSAKILKHARGMLHHPTRYVWARTLHATWKSWTGALRPSVQ